MHNLYVDTDAQLRELCQQLASAPYLALDTEFIRERTYHPVLCLVQVAGNDLVACVDPIAIADISPLLDLIYNPATLKIMHAARQDLEIFFLRRNDLPENLFDTQVAAAFLGYGDQIGYGPLVRATLGVELKKGQVRTDWAKRPLDADQVRYAADDVRYLGAVYDKLVGGLEKRGRLEWAQEEIATQFQRAIFQVPPEDAWQFVKGWRRLEGVQLAALQKLAGWRELEAERTNRPVGWVVKDDALIEIAKQMPANLGRITRIRGLEDVANRHGAKLLQLVEEAREVPEEQWPIATATTRLTAQQESVADLLMTVLRHLGWQEDVSPSILATRRDLEQFVAGREDVPLAKGWRYEMAGSRLRALMNGELSVRLKRGRLLLEKV